MIITLVVAVVAGVVPMLAYATILWWLDRWEKEPLPLLAAVFLWGFIPSAIFALIAQVILDIPAQLIYTVSPLAGELFTGSIVAPFTEELIKGVAVLLVFIFWQHEFDSVLDGIVYGSLVGFGFAAIENVLYFTSFSDELVCLVPMRAFLFGLNHAFFTSLIGIGFALARFEKRIWLKILYPLLGFGGAMLAHGLHNGLVTFGLIGLPFAILADWMGALVIFIIIIVSLRHEARWIRTYLAEEVDQGILTAAQARRISSFWGRYAADLQALGRGGAVQWRRTYRFHHVCTELAFKKHQYKRKLGDMQRKADLIAKLRSEVVELSSQVA